MKKLFKEINGGGSPRLMKIVMIVWFAGLAAVIIMQVIPQGQLSDSGSTFAIDKILLHGL